jgi:hypothetical protein
MTEERQGDFAAGERAKPQGPARDFAEGEEREPPGPPRDFAEGEEQEPPGPPRDFAEGEEQEPRDRRATSPRVKKTRRPASRDDYPASRTSRRHLRAAVQFGIPDRPLASG